ncbi:MAG: glycosyltransferase family 2 protein [Acetobacteraceae bacterium]
MRLIAGRTPPAGRPYDADVVILALDRPDDTLIAIGSALAQGGVSRHLTVLDQGSAPGTLDRLAARIAGRTDACLFRSERNQGVAGGRNLASAIGHGRVIAALDNDAVFAAPDTLSRLVAALDAEPGLAAIGCRILRDDDGSDDRTSWGYPAGRLSQAGESFDAVTYVGAGHAIRRTAWTAAGGYDPTLFFCWEEYDFCLRAIALGWRVRYRGDIAIRHRLAEEHRMRWGDHRWFHFVRNRLYIARKYGAGWPAIAPRTVGYLIKGMANGLPGPTLRAIAAAIAMGRNVTPVRLPEAARDYLRRNDTLQRESWMVRLRREVLAALPRPPSPVNPPVVSPAAAAE